MKSDEEVQSIAINWTHSTGLGCVSQFPTGRFWNHVPKPVSDLEARASAFGYTHTMRAHHSALGRSRRDRARDVCFSAP